MLATSCQPVGAIHWLVSRSALCDLQVIRPVIMRGVSDVLNTCPKQTSGVAVGEHSTKHLRLLIAFIRSWYDARQRYPGQHVMPETPSPPPDSRKPDAAKRVHGKPLVLAIAFIAVELVGIAGLVLAPRLDLGNVALVAVAGAMMIVPILFVIALRTSRRR